MTVEQQIQAEESVREIAQNNEANAGVDQGQPSENQQDVAMVQEEQNVENNQIYNENQANDSYLQDQANAGEVPQINNGEGYNFELNQQNT